MNFLLVPIREACRKSAGLTLVITVMLMMVLASVGLSSILYVVAWGFQVPYPSLVSILQGDWEAIPQALAAFRLIQFGYQWVVWALTAALMFRLVYPGQQFRWAPVQVNGLWIPPLLMVLSLPLVSMLHLPAESLHLPEAWRSLEYWIKEQESLGQEVLQRVLERPEDLVWNLLVFAITPAICEELFFRGWLQKQFERFLPPHAAVWVSAAVFSFIHLQFLGFFSRLVLGALLGYIYQNSKNLIPSMVAHAAFNSISIVAIAMGMSMDQEPGALPGIAGWGLALLSAVLTGGGLYYFQHLTARVYNGSSHE